MEIRDIVIDGFLDSGGDLIPVEVAYASIFTVFVRFKEGNRAAYGAEYRRLTLKISGREFEFGPCRLVAGQSSAEYEGRLQFFADLIDFDVFFREKKILNLETLTNNLALILSQKDKVKGQFKNYIADLAYDIKAYKQFFDEIDMKLMHEPEDVRDSVFQAVADTLGVKFAGFYDDGLNELERLITGYSKEEHELHGYYLRKQLWDIIMCSEFMARTNIKPRGYAGDSEMMRMLYENEYTGNSTFSKILNKYSLGVPAAQSVRNRRIMIPGILRKVQGEFAERIEGPLRIMSVACGPAYELSDLFVTPDDCGKFHCTLLDQDHDALNEAVKNIHRIEKSFGRTIQAEYLRDSVRTMLRTPELHEKWGRFHFIYSMGLFDYLTQPVAKAVIGKIYSLLEPGGFMFIGNYHFQNKSRWFMEYWLDWVLYYRSEDDMNDLVSDIETATASIMFEGSECQMFLLAQKPLR
jgi:extracellular factor (EF) 3-hydroxypalmitic acid methyl ester biosynthesis protein